MPEHAVLQGRFVRLEPLTLDHLAGLETFAFDEDLWRWTPNAVRNREELVNYIESALMDHKAGSALPFAIVSRQDACVAGCTRFGNIDIPNRRLEIGWTWVGRPWQRTAVNTETKLLLMTHAFETLGLNRVELKTDALNARSRRAIHRLGAKEEGILRKHIVTASGRLRDTVYFSVLDDEWPGVKQGLEEKLAASMQES